MWADETGRNEPAAETAAESAAHTPGEHDSPLANAVREVEAHAHEAGWDRAPQLFALVPTDELLAREPALAGQLGIDLGEAAGTLTPVEQEALPADRSLEDSLAEIVWPREVTGCAAVLERITLPPEAEDQVPDDATLAQQYAESHPDRHEVRIAVGVSRYGDRHCVLRVRTHEGALVQGPDLVPSLIRLLHATLDD